MRVSAVPELVTVLKEVADLKTNEQLDRPVPEAHFETVVVQPSKIQKEMMVSLSERAAKVHAVTVDASVDNIGPPLPRISLREQRV